jgi:hypothetical protein
MSFRRRRNEWDEFLKRHRAELRACGVPDHVTATRLRFLLFLDHGFDQWGWAENRHAAVFNGDLLTDEQLRRLAELVAAHVDARYRVPVASGWRRLS